MKKLLPQLNNLLTMSIRRISVALWLLVLLIAANDVKAQVYYVTNDASPSVGSGDAIVRMDYNGSGATTLASSITTSPSLLQIDYANNRAFVYEAYQPDPVPNPNNLAIKVINLTNGTVIRSIPLAVVGRATSLEYDPINDYIYYVTGDPLNADAANATSNDALIRVKPDGTGSTILASGFCKNPAFLALNIANNEIYIYQNLYADPRIYVRNLSGGAVRDFVTTKPAAPYTGVDMAYDNINNYIYYLTSDNSDGVSAKDALKRINPDGTGETTISSSIGGGVMYAMAIDVGHNKAYFFDKAAGANRGINSVDLTTGSVSLVKSIASPTLVAGLAAPSLPVVATTTVSTYSGTSATMGGNVTRSDVSVTERGVVYTSTNTTPTIGASGVTKATNGTGTGSFSASVTGLSAATTYYVRAYATSAAGNNYGTVTSFTTQSNDANLSALSISAGTLTPGFTSATTSYTATVANANSTITITPTRNNATASIQVNNIAATSGSGSTVNLSTGDNAIPVKVTAQDGTTTKTYTITVTRPKAAQTITFASTATKTYGDADFAPGATTTSGLSVSYSSDNIAVATIVSGQIHIVGQGTANITASQAGDASYLAASNVVQTLTVNKNAITVTATAGQTKVYGSAEPTFAYTVTSGTVKTGDSFTGALGRAAGESVGSYALTQNTLTLGNNYTLNFVSNDFGITKRAITITPTIQTKVYGNSDPASFTYTIGGMGLASGDGMTGLFERPVGENVGVYNLGIGAKHPVNLNNGTDQSGNYDITFVSNTLTITKRPLSIAPLPVTKVYGTADFASGAPYSLGGTTLAPGDAMTGTFGRDNTSENVGVYALTLGLKRPIIAATGEDMSGNYNITFTTNTFTITAKSIAVNVYSQTKVYGDADPALTYTSEPLAFSDTFTGALTRDAGESVGTYAINQGTLTLSSNYNIVYVGANLVIGAKTINVTAAATTKNYGDADPAFNYTSDALAVGDNFTGSLTRDAGENTGAYAITQGTLALSSNYIINYTGANLSIGKATLNYVATPVSRPAQTANPIFTGSVTGFVNGDNLATATTGTLSFTSTANLSSAMGSYPIIGAGLSAVNYNFVQDAGNSTALTVTASADANLAGLTVDKGTLNPAFSSEQTSYGFSVDNNVPSFNLTATTNQPNATININGNIVTSGSSKNILLNTGSNNLNVIVTAQDGVTVKYYTLNIFRAYDTNNLLASINLSGLTYSPSFNANTLNYTATVSNLVASTDVTATAVAPTTHILVGGYDLATTSPVTTTLNVGETDVVVVSKAENGDEKIYKVKVTRAQSIDATLASIGNNTITLNTPFVSSTHTYSTTVAASVGALTFLPVATNNAAVIKVNNQNLNPGPGNNVNLSFGANAVTIDVTSEDGTKHIAYVLNIYRLRSSDAALASLSFPFITSLNEQFNPDVFNYTATVADSTYTGIPLSAIAANENAVVKIDGTVVPRFANYSLPVHGGPNTYHIVVTSQDTSVTKTYTLVLTRAGTPPPAQSPVANLLALNVSSGSAFSKNFNFSNGEELTTIYTPNSVASVRLYTVAQVEASTVTVNGIVLPYDTTTDLLPIAVGDNLFTVLVTSEDGAHTKSYAVHVNRLPFADVSLASISINAGSLTPAFNSATKTYSVSVPNNITSIGVKPVATVGTATITVSGTEISSSNPIANVDLYEGTPNRIRIVVTAADGVTRQTYTLNVTREAPPLSTNASLASLAVSPYASLAIQQNTSNLVEYTTSVNNSTTSITLTPTVKEPNATVTVNGSPVISGVASDPIILNTSGVTIIDVVVTAQNGSTIKTYRVAVNNTGATVASLESLSITPASPLTLTSSTSSLTAYNTFTGIGTTSVTLIPKLKDPNATLSINGVPTTSGVASAPITLTSAVTTINVVVTAEDGVTTKTYTVTVNRTGSSNTALASLSTTPSSKVTIQSSTSNTVEYTTSVSAVTSSISLTALLKDSNATMTINGIPAVSGQASSIIPLEMGTTTVPIIVTAEDGVTTKLYNLTVNRNGLSVASLASLNMSPASVLTVTSNSVNLMEYVTSVSAGTTSITLTPKLKDPNSTMTINGVPAADGAASTPISLNIGATTITINVTAEDGITTKTHTLVVNHSGSTNASLTALSVTPSSKLIAQQSTSRLVEYTTSVSYGVTSIKIIPTVKDVNATITINGSPATSGVASDPILLPVGVTTATVIITAEDGVTTKTYTLAITRAGSNNANLAHISISPGSVLSIKTNTQNLVEYTTTVSANTASIKLKPTLKEPNATFTINGIPGSNDVFTSPIALSAGTNTIDIVVTAQNGTTVKTYVIMVTKPSPATIMVDRNNSNLLFANKTAGNVAPTNDDGVVVHQGVSPNGDGANDFLYIEGIGAYPGNRLSIMNTNGALVFEVEDYGKDGNNLFDGHSNKNGALLKPGTYYYSLEYSVDKQARRKTGYIIIKY